MLAGNAAESIFNVSGKLPGHPSRNVAGLSIIPMLVDPIHRNFRPKGGSALASLGAGAYSLGGEYWIPGQQRYLPSHPVPAHGAIWRLPHSKSVELLWRSGYNANSNRLVVSRHVNGTKIESFQLNIAVADGKSAGSYMWTPEFSEHSLTKVDWRVDSIEGGSIRRGWSWSFVLQL